MKRLSFSVCELKCLHNLLLRRNIKNSQLVIKKAEDALTYYIDDVERTNNKIFYNVVEDEQFFPVSLQLDKIEIDVLKELARECASDIKNAVNDSSRFRYN